MAALCTPRSESPLFGHSPTRRPSLEDEIAAASDTEFEFGDHDDLEVQHEQSDRCEKGTSTDGSSCNHNHPIGESYELEAHSSPWSVITPCQIILKQFRIKCTTIFQGGGDKNDQTVSLLALIYQLHEDIGKALGCINPNGLGADEQAGMVEALDRSVEALAETIERLRKERDAARIILEEVYTAYRQEHELSLRKTHILGEIAEAMADLQEKRSGHQHDCEGGCDPHHEASEMQM